MSEPSPQQIKDTFPNEWKGLCRRYKEMSKPGLPLDVYREMKSKGSRLVDRVIRFGPTKDIPFVSECLLLWEGPDYRDVILSEVLTVQPRPGATKEEKQLMKLQFDTRVAYDLVFDAIHRAPEFKEFQKDIREFLNEVTALEKKYSFDPDDVISG